MALDDTVKIYEDLRTDLDAAFPVVTQSILASLVESETITRSAEGKCRQMLRRKADAVTRKVDAERKIRMEKLQKELSQKSKVNEPSLCGYFIISPHRQNCQQCGLLLQMSHVPWSVCVVWNTDKPCKNCSTNQNAILGA